MILDPTEVIKGLREFAETYPLLTNAIAFLGGSASDVYILEPLKRRRERRRKELEHARLQATTKAISEGLSGRLFSLAGVTTRIYVLDFSIDGYEPRALVSHQVSFSDVTPDQYKILYSHHRLRWDALLKARKIYDGAKGVTPRKVSIDRIGSAEKKSIRFDFSISPGYVHDRSVCDVFQSLDVPVRQKMVSEPSTTMEPFFSTGFGVMLSVITSDGLLTFARRSSSSAIHASKIVCGVAELTTEVDVHQKQFDVYETSRRALREELGINLQANELYAIEITACIFDTEYHEWTMLGHIDLRRLGKQYTSDVLLEYKATAKGHDAWEVADLYFIEFTPSAVAGYIQSHADQILDASKVGAIYALLSVLRDRTAIVEAFGLYQQLAKES